MSVASSLRRILQDICRTFTVYLAYVSIIDPDFKWPSFHDFDSI